MPLENLADVRLFVQVVDSGGLSAASRVLAVPANTVSRTLSRLEHAVGARLLARTTRTMSLTDEGRRFYELALKLLDAARCAEEALAPPEGELAGLLRVAVRTTTVQFGFVPDLLALLTQHPGLRVELLVVDDEVDLVKNGLDLALRVGELPDSSLRGRLLGSVTFVLAAAPSYVQRAGKPERPRDLAAHECITTTLGRARSEWVLLDREGKRATASVGGRFACKDVRTQREGIYAGFGIGIRPLGEVRRAVATGELNRILPRWTLEPLPVRIVLPSRRSSATRARGVEAVVDLIAEAIARMA